MSPQPLGGHDAEAANPWAVQLDALGAFIRTQRQLAQLSLREMASLTSVSNAYLSQVERGLHQPSSGSCARSPTRWNSTPNSC